MKSRYKVGDIILAKSVAGDGILPVHHKLLRRVVVKPSKGNSMDWPGYSGWETVLVCDKEIEYLNKEWCIPITKKSETFVYDHCVIKRVKEAKVSQKILNKLASRKKIKRGRNAKKKEAKNPPKRKSTRTRRNKGRRKIVGPNS